MSWEAVIGLEVHVQLATRTKIFCGCPNRFGDPPNTNVCEVCTGQPGVLPVLNRQAVAYAIRAALALNCTIRTHSVFARKHYFYPDLPKGYQISQYELPYAEHGYLEIPVDDGGTKRIGITRIHMEEDAGKNIHAASGDHSLVDFNRAGAPLIEIVSEPDMRSAAEAGAYLRELRSILRYLGVSDADMEKGNFRCDANVSVRPAGSETLGTKTELKNINSFRFVERALAYEIERQIAVLEGGGEVVQETRLWDTTRNVTVPMRSKEEAHDYRYFPEPDLPPLVLDEAWLEAERAALPELPAAKRRRYVEQYGLPAYDAGVLTAERAVAEYFEAVAAGCGDPKLASNWVMNEVLRVADPDRLASFAIPPARLVELLGLLQAERISGKIAKEVFEAMLTEEGSPTEIVERRGLFQITDSDALAATIDEILAAHPEEVTRYRNGERKLLGYFMGQVMRATRGKANPELAQRLLREQLEA